jgi:hypothetical protein
MASNRPTPDLEPFSAAAISLSTHQAIQGCNLFVFHLPDDWTDEDLLEYFAPHGNVVSAKAGVALGPTCTNGGDVIVGPPMKVGRMEKENDGSNQ